MEKILPCFLKRAFLFKKKDKLIGKKPLVPVIKKPLALALKWFEKEEHHNLINGEFSKSRKVDIAWKGKLQIRLDNL